MTVTVTHSPPTRIDMDALGLTGMALELVHYDNSEVAIERFCDAVQRVGSAPKRG